MSSKKITALPAVSSPSLSDLVAGVDISPTPTTKKYTLAQILSLVVSLPAGGTIGQILTKLSSTDGDADWQDPAPAGVWGAITGDILDQTDLIAELTDLADAIDLKVTGPASATANAIARYSGTTGKLVKDSSVTVADNGTMTAGDGSAPSYVPGGPSLVISSTDDDNGIVIRSEGSGATVESFISNWAGAGVAGGFAGTLSAHPYFFGTGGINRFSIDANGETIFAKSVTPGGNPYAALGAVVGAIADSADALDAFGVYDENLALKAKIDKDGKFFGPSGDDLQTQISAVKRSVAAFTGTAITPGASENQTHLYTGGSVQTFTGFGALSGLTEGMRLTLMGSSDTNYLSLSESDASDGWLMRGPLDLERGRSITFEYNSTLARMNEVSRS